MHSTPLFCWARLCTVRLSTQLADVLMRTLEGWAQQQQQPLALYSRSGWQTNVEDVNQAAATVSLVLVLTGDA
jgi:hypothetical protein